MIAVVCHDAGGAEVLSSYVRRRNLDCRYVLAGPAMRVFERKLGRIVLDPLEGAIDAASTVWCGTSWQSNLELDAIAAARRAGKRSMAFFDHWVNYPERLTRHGKACLPDEIWVGDVIAEAIARTVFPALPIRREENPYFEDIREQLQALPPRRLAADGLASVLYVTEPIREHALRQFGDERHWGYVEEDALRYFLTHAAAVVGGPVGRIVIRLHPAEPAGKYSWAAREFDLPLEIGGARPLVEEVAEADMVAGCESMAMVVGLLAGKRVLSTIPPGGFQCRLPHPQIEHCQELVAASRAELP